MSDSEKFSSIRNEYKLNKLLEQNINPDPVVQFKRWYEDVKKNNLQEPDAMVLATANKNGKPSSRIVLLRRFDENGFVFFTNYLSKKGKEIDDNPYAALLLFWRELERQVRIEGKVEKISKKESEEYFYSRPYESKIGAWISQQSTVIPNRDFLEKEFEVFNSKFHDDKEVPKPEFWGGYKMVPDYFEFWQGRAHRLHDRIAYKKGKGEWKFHRLAP